MSRQDPVPPPEPLRPIPWWIAICGLVAIGLSIWGVYQWLSSAASGAGNAKDAQIQVDIIRNALTVGAGLGGVAALLLAFRRQQFVERQHGFYERQQQHHELTAKLDYEQRERTARHVEDDATHRRITEMRIQAVEQLGSDKAPVRIGGLHNLERLGEDHPELRPLVLSEICAYLRMPFQVPAAALRLQAADEEPGALDEHNVRQTAQRVLKRHLSGGPADPHYWEHEALDLADATLHGLDLRGCHAHNANFYYARFHGTTRLEGAQFFGTVNFSNARFHGVAGFRGAVFHGPSGFMSVKFHNTADFEAAEFDAEPKFTGASAPLDHAHTWPGWSLAPDPRQTGMGSLKPDRRLPDRSQRHPHHSEHVFGALDILGGPVGTGGAGIRRARPFVTRRPRLRKPGSEARLPTVPTTDHRRLMVSSPFQPPTFTIAMRGYDVAQVNQLVTRIAQAHTDPAAAAAVAAELRATKFATVPRGFKAKQVDEYLARAAAVMAASPQPPVPGPAPTAAVPSLSTRPRGERFPKRFGGAYRTGDVDAFVERVSSTLNTTLTSHETHSVRFGNALRGYDVEAVDNWIDQVRENLLARGR